MKYFVAILLFVGMASTAVIPQEEDLERLRPQPIPAPAPVPAPSPGGFYAYQNSAGAPPGYANFQQQQGAFSYNGQGGQPQQQFGQGGSVDPIAAWMFFGGFPISTGVVTDSTIAASTATATTTATTPAG